MVAGVGGEGAERRVKWKSVVIIIIVHLVRNVGYSTAEAFGSALDIAYNAACQIKLKSSEVFDAFSSNRPLHLVRFFDRCIGMDCSMTDQYLPRPASTFRPRPQSPRSSSRPTRSVQRG